MTQPSMMYVEAVQDNGPDEHGVYACDRYFARLMCGTSMVLEVVFESPVESEVQSEAEDAIARHLRTLLTK